MAFKVNGSVYPYYYLLADGIYLQWSCFVQAIHESQGEKRTHFTKYKEHGKMLSMCSECCKSARCSEVRLSSITACDYTSLVQFGGVSLH